MKNLKNLKVLAWTAFWVTGFFYASASYCGSSPQASSAPVKLFVELNPAGSFIAHTDQILGSVKKMGGKWVAENIEIDLRSLKTGISLRDKHMKKKYFQTDQFPKAVLSQGSGKDGSFSGELVIRDIKKKISGEFEVQGSKVKATFTTKLSDFEIPEANYMGVGVEDEVKVEVLVPVSR